MFMFLGINVFWAFLRLILGSNESESGPKQTYVREHKLYCYILQLDWPADSYASLGGPVDQ